MLSYAAKKSTRMFIEILLTIVKSLKLTMLSVEIINKYWYTYHHWNIIQH